jgi:hypothetical protein
MSDWTSHGFIARSQYEERAVYVYGYVYGKRAEQQLSVDALKRRTVEARR